METFIRYTAISFLFILLTIGKLFAQKEANHWIFDINTYLDFSSGSPVATVPPQGSCGNWVAPSCYFFLGGNNASCISDKNGDLVLYTNNNIVYNQNFDTIQNGIISGSYNSKQSLIIPRPQRPNRYYVITTPWWQASQGVKFTEVDIYANGGSGSAISSNNMLLPFACQKVTAVYHKNQIDIWVLVHQYHSNAFYAFLVTKYGINLTPVISNIGTIHTEDPNTNFCTADMGGNGEMKFSTQGDKVACAIKGLDIVEVLDFNNENGVLSNPVPISCGEVESVEFSPDGTLLYTGSFPIPLGYTGCNLILEGNSSKIRQFDLISGDSLTIVNSNKLIHEQSFGWKQFLQIGPDRKVYSIFEDSNTQHEYIGVISNPNDTGVLCNYNSHGFIFPTNYLVYDRNVLPNFFRSALDRNILFEDICFGDTTMIFTLTNTNFDSIMWEFENVELGYQSIWNEDTVFFNFSRPGSYTITLNRYRDGYLDQTEKTLNILPTINLSFTDTTVCQGSEYVFDLNVPYCDFGWINNASPDTFLSDSFVINQNTMFWPVLMNFHDYCGSMDNILISIYQDTLDLGNDTADICINSPLTLNASLSNAISYEWTTGDSTSLISPGQSGEYWVKVTTQEACNFTDTIEISYDLIPSGQLDSVDYLCTDSSLTLSVNDTNNLYVWYPMQNTSSAIIIDSIGAYWFVSTNSCGFFSDTIQIVELSSPIIQFPADTVLCEGDSILLDAWSTQCDYSWSTGDTIPAIFVSIPGNYSVIVSNECGSGVDDFLLSTIAVPLIELGNDTTICLGDSVLIGNPPNIEYSYLWSTNDSSSQIYVSAFNQYLLTVINSCGLLMDSIQVSTHTNDFSFSQDTIHLDSLGSIIIDAGHGYESYYWSTMEMTSSIFVSSTGLFWVEVVDSIGCRASDTLFVAPFIGIDENQIEGLNFYPNPISSTLKISGLEERDQVRIYTNDAKLLYQNTVTDNTITIDFTKYASGIYLIKIQRLNKSSSCKVLKR